MNTSEYNKKYYQKNKIKLLKYQKEYRKKHGKAIYERRKEKLKTYYQETGKAKKQIRAKQYKEAWSKIIKEHYGEIKCPKCGFDEDFFPAYDFHHEDPNEKELTINSFITSRKPTPERVKLVIEELKKGQFLCAICHRKVHFSL